jgi:hypothetical protein
LRGARPPDALGWAAFRHRFDLAKHRWRTDSIDADRRDNVLDALGRPIESRDSKGALTLATFDLLHRLSRVSARDRSGGTVTLRQRIEYGDAGDPQQPGADRAAHPDSGISASFDHITVVRVADSVKRIRRLRKPIISSSE